MKFLQLLICLFLFGCETHKISQHVTLANEQMHTFCKEMYKEKNLFVIGAGGALMDQISELSISFDSYDNRKLTIPEARRLIIDIVERLRKEVNENEGIRLHLSNYPIGPNNIRIDIAFYEKRHKLPHVSEEFVGLVRQRDGMVFYSHYDSIENRYKNGGYRESYEEALRIVEEERAVKNE